MKRRILTIVGIALIVFVGGLTAILVSAFSTNIRVSAVSRTTTFSGNGGNAVAVGGYLYFVGNFHSAQALAEEGRSGNIYGRPGRGNRLTHGAIWRIQLNQSGLPQYDNSWIEGWQDEWNSWHPDYNGGPLPHHLDNLRAENQHFDVQHDSRFVQGTLELVVPKVAGHEKSALFVMGNHLIYTSPHNYQRGDGTLQVERTDFFRVDLTGANHRLIYTTRHRDHQVSRGDFTVAWVNGQSHLLVREPYDGGLNRITHVNVSHNPGRTHVLTTSATSWVFPTVTASYHNNDDSLKGFGGVMDFVYWSEQRPQEDIDRLRFGDIIFRYCLRNRTDETVADDLNTRYQLVSLSRNNLVWKHGTVTPTAQPFPQRPVVWEMRITSSIDSDVFASGAISSGNPRVRTAATTFNEDFEIFAPTEGGGINFTYFTLFDNRIMRWQTPSNGNEFTHTAIPGITGVEQILKVTGSRIFFLTANGTQVRAIDFFGNTVRETVNISTDRINEINISIFNPINTDGQRFRNDNYVISYIITVHPVLGQPENPDDPENPETPTGPNPITIAVIRDLNNNTHRLWNLLDEFVGIED